MSTYLTTKEVAHILRIHPVTVRRWLNEGAIPTAVKLSDRGGWRVRPEDLERFMQERNERKAG